MPIFGLFETKTEKKLKADVAKLQADLAAANENTVSAKADLVAAREEVTAVRAELSGVQEIAAAREVTIEALLAGKANVADEVAALRTRAEASEAEVEKLSAGTVDNLQNQAVKLGKETLSGLIDTGTSAVADVASQLSEKFNSKNLGKTVDLAQKAVSFGKKFFGPKK